MSQLLCDNIGEMELIKDFTAASEKEKKSSKLKCLWWVRGRNG